MSMGIESLDERLTAAHARREAGVDALVRALIAIDDATRDMDELIEQRLEASR